jgi:hypothetical protein
MEKYNWLGSSIQTVVRLTTNFKKGLEASAVTLDRAPLECPWAGGSDAA